MATAHLTARPAPVKLDIHSGDIEAGPLRMDPDTGLVRRFIDPGDGYDIDVEPCGFVGDEDNAPPDLAEDWEQLLDYWNDSRGYADACLRTADAAWAGRFDSRGWR